MTLAQFKTALVAAAIALTVIGCGKAETLDDSPVKPKPNPPVVPTGTTLPAKPLSDISFQYRGTVLPIEPEMDPQSSKCHLLAKSLIAKSSLVLGNTFVRLTRDNLEVVFADNKPIGTLSDESNFFFFDQLIPDLVSTTDIGFVVRIALQGNIKRPTGSAMAYGGKYNSSGEFQKLCFIPMKLNFQMSLN